ANKRDLLEILKTEQTDNMTGSETPAVTEAPAEVAKPETQEQAKVTASTPLDEPGLVTEGTSAEITRLEDELLRLRAEEEARRSAVEAARLTAENSLHIEQEKWRQAEEEMARQRAEHERKRIEAEARERAEEQKRREIADQELARAEED